MRTLRLLGVLGLVSLLGATCADGLAQAVALTTQDAGPLVGLGSGAAAGVGAGSAVGPMPMPAELEAPAVADVFRVIDLTGVFGNAAVGGVIARAERLDPVGFAPGSARACACSPGGTAGCCRPAIRGRRVRWCPAAPAAA